MLFGISGTEIIVVLLVGLLLADPAKLPGYARRAGKMLSQVRKKWRSAKDLVDAETHDITDLLDVSNKHGKQI